MANGPLPKKFSSNQGLQVRYKNPKVAQMYARLYLRSNGDMELAVRTLNPSATPSAVAATAGLLMQRPEISEAIEKELEQLGLDDTSFSIEKRFELRLVGQLAFVDNGHDLQP